MAAAAATTAAAAAAAMASSVATVSSISSSAAYTAAAAAVLPARNRAAALPARFTPAAAKKLRSQRRSGKSSQHARCQAVAVASPPATASTPATPPNASSNDAEDCGKYLGYGYRNYRDDTPVGVVMQILEAYNSQDAEKIVSFFTEDAIFQMAPAGNPFPAVQGKSTIINMVPMLIKKGLARGSLHRITNITVVGDFITVDLMTKYYRDGIPDSEYPATDVFRMKGNEVDELRIYFDLAPLFRDAMIARSLGDGYRATAIEDETPLGTVMKVLEAYNQQDAEKVVDYFTEDATFQMAPTGNPFPAVKGRSTIVNMVPMLIKKGLARGSHHKITGITQTGDYIVVELMTHYYRDNLGIPDAEYPAFDVFRMKGNKVDELRIYFDLRPLFADVAAAKGASPPAGGDAHASPAAPAAAPVAAAPPAGPATTIAKDAGYIVVQNVFRTTKEAQNDMLRSVENLNKMLAARPGFVSAALHAGLDGTTVLNYIQFQNDKAFIEACSVLPIAGTFAAYMASSGLVPDPPRISRKQAFTVHATRGANPPTTVQENASSVAVLVMFQVDSPAMIDALLGDIAEFIQTVERSPGFISANFHVSADRTRAFNYAQWTSLQAYKEANELPDYKRGLQAILKYKPLVGGPSSVYRVHKVTKPE